MASLDIAKLEYEVKIVTPAGETLDLSQFVTSCNWSDPAKEIASRASISFANIKSSKGLISSLLKLCTLVYIYANKKEVFRGVVWEWECTSAANKEVSITAYDKMIYATQSKDNYYYTTGKGTKAIVEDICNRSGIKVNYKWESYTHAKTTVKSKAISEEIMQFLEEAEKKLTTKYAAYMKADVLQIVTRGNNTDVWVLNDENSMSIKDKLSMSQLVTKVIVVGKEDKAGRPPVEATVNGDLKYGTLQEIIQRSTNQSIADATAEANQLIKDRGTPEETITLQSPDVPTIRKGDKVKVVAGSFNQHLYVKGVTHDAKAKTMTLELER